MSFYPNTIDDYLILFVTYYSEDECLRDIIKIFEEVLILQMCVCVFRTFIYHSSIRRHFCSSFALSIANLARNSTIGDKRYSAFRSLFKKGRASARRQTVYGSIYPRCSAIKVRRDPVTSYIIVKTYREYQLRVKSSLYQSDAEPSGSFSYVYRRTCISINSQPPVITRL